MSPRRSSYRGCLLGLAVGDAMGYTVDSRSWQEIREDYGPNGLMGYDLVNGYAEVTSYTQMAAFAANGLLLGVTVGQVSGQMAPFVSYVNLSLREWAAAQRVGPRPGRSFCWLSHCQSLCRRSCMDTWMLDTLSREARGTLETPVNNFAAPEALSAAVGVGLFYDRDRMSQPEIDRLGAEAVALVHGGPGAFLTGAVIAHLISRTLRETKAPLRKLFIDAVEAVEQQFGSQYSQVYEIKTQVRQAMIYAQSPGITGQAAMEQLKCETAPQVLAGAVYACLAAQDFDGAMVLSVNHSGRSAAVGALTGAILGARMGEKALPGFYLECLEPADVLREVADDLFHGCPLGQGNRMFDQEWDRKYRHGGQ